MSGRAARLGVTLVTLAAWSLAACGKPPAPAECDALLDHYVELLVNSDRPGTSAGELHKLQAQARQKATEDPEFRDCSQRVSRRAYECAMSASNADKLEQCLL
jgi:hypothetical protein